MEKSELLKYIRKNRIRIKTHTQEAKEVLLLQLGFRRRFLPDKSGFYYQRTNGPVRFWADPAHDVYMVLIRMEDKEYHVLKKYCGYRGFIDITKKFRIRVPKG